MQRPKSVSELPAIVRPMQQGLPLTGTAERVTGLTVPLYGGNMPPKGLPPFDLSPILFGQSTPHEVAAVPLEPSPRVVLMDPAVLTPDG
jgi:hypothetical protein